MIRVSRLGIHPLWRWDLVSIWRASTGMKTEIMCRWWGCSRWTSQLQPQHLKVFHSTSVRYSQETKGMKRWNKRIIGLHRSPICLWELSNWTCRQITNQKRFLIWGKPNLESLTSQRQRIYSSLTWQMQKRRKLKLDKWLCMPANKQSHRWL